MVSSSILFDIIIHTGTNWNSWRAISYIPCKSIYPTTSKAKGLIYLQVLWTFDCRISIIVIINLLLSQKNKLSYSLACLTYNPGMACIRCTGSGANNVTGARSAVPVVSDPSLAVSVSCADTDLATAIVSPADTVSFLSSLVLPLALSVMAEELIMCWTERNHDEQRLHVYLCSSG